MCHLQLKTLIFVAWVLGYIAFLLSIRRMWTGKYVRSPLVRSLLVNMVSENDAAATETQQVRTISMSFIHSFFPPVFKFGELWEQQMNP